jgi:hypothetical protein
MPQSIAIGLLVLGGVLLLVAITGGNFKIFGAEVDSPVSSTPIRFLAGLLGGALILTALVQNKLSASSPSTLPASNQPATSSLPSLGGSGSASGSASSSGANSLPSPQNISVIPQGQPAKQGSDTTFESPSASNSQPLSVTSANEFAIVFDPPSNVRTEPTVASDTLCSVTTKTSIRILGSEGPWYQTDVCEGKLGYIHRSQIKF